VVVACPSDRQDGAPGAARGLLALASPWLALLDLSLLASEESERGLPVREVLAGLLCVPAPHARVPRELAQLWLREAVLAPDVGLWPDDVGVSAAGEPLSFLPQTPPTTTYRPYHDPCVGKRLLDLASAARSEGAEPLRAAVHLVVGRSPLACDRARQPVRGRDHVPVQTGWPPLGVPRQ